MGVYYALITCMDLDHHHFCLSLKRFWLFQKVCFILIKLSVFYFIFFFLLLLCFIYFLFFVSFVYAGGWTIVRKENCPPLGLEFRLALGLGLELGQFSLGAIVLKPFFTSGKQGDFSYNNEILGFIHLLHVQSCTILYILNELNGII